MKILISSHFFPPSVGGIEQVSGILAEEFAKMGHEVKVVTTTTAKAEPPGQSFEVCRRPSIADLFAHLRWCDAYLQSNISVATFWPAVLLRKPTLIVYHTWLTRVGGKIGWRDRIKRQIGRLAAKNMAVSEALGKSLFSSCDVIPNPYRDDLFTVDPEARRHRELVFLGRLVTDKGVDLLMDAMTLLRERGLTPNLSIIGSGPHEAKLREQVRRQDLEQQVSFLGVRIGAELVRILNGHQIMVIPSRWTEPFGLVALEGIACGLVAVGSSNGGLPDAIGPCGEIFHTGNAQSLADCLERVLRNPSDLEKYREPAKEHLARHSRRGVAEAYVRELFRLSGSVDVTPELEGIRQER
jgi:glycosyltransferase involved in cell wall biosynthesis